MSRAESTLHDSHGRVVTGDRAKEWASPLYIQVTVVEHSGTHRLPLTALSQRVRLVTKGEIRMWVAVRPSEIQHDTRAFEAAGSDAGSAPERGVL